MSSCSLTMVDLGMGGGTFFFLKMETLINISVKRHNKTVSQFENILNLEFQNNLF